MANTADHYIRAVGKGGWVPAANQAPDRRPVSTVTGGTGWCRFLWTTWGESSVMELERPRLGI